MIVYNILSRLIGASWWIHKKDPRQEEFSEEDGNVKKQEEEIASRQGETLHTRTPFSPLEDAVA